MHVILITSLTHADRSSISLRGRSRIPLSFFRSCVSYTRHLSYVYKVFRDNRSARGGCNKEWWKKHFTSNERMHFGLIVGEKDLKMENLCTLEEYVMWWIFLWDFYKVKKPILFNTNSRFKICNDLWLLINFLYSWKKY